LNKKWDVNNDMSGHYACSVYTHVCVCSLASLGSGAELRFRAFCRACDTTFLLFTRKFFSSLGISKPRRTSSFSSELQNTHTHTHTHTHDYSKQVMNGIRSKLIEEILVVYSVNDQFNT